MKNLRPLALAATVALTLALPACGKVGDDKGSAGGTQAAAGGYVNVVKLTGIAWFDRMEVGVKDFAKESGKPATQTGPATDSPEQQVSIIQQQIAQKPAGLGIVPSDPGAIDAVIKQAKGAGIKVITHEAPQLTTPDADIEAFDNAAYGASIMEGLGGCMKGEGEYVQYVGKLTATTHMTWADSGYQLQQKKFPKMKRIGTPVESMDNADTAYTKTKQLLQANPKLKGFTGASSQDVPGIARAIREAGLQEQTCVFGTGVPSETKDFLKDGAIDRIYFWDPAKAGQAVMKALQLLVEGKPLTDGTDLGVDGYRKITVSKSNPKVFLGDANLSADKTEVEKYGF